MSEPRIFHCVEKHMILEPGERHRHKKVFESWAVLYANGVIPAHYEEYKRTAKDIGDKRDLPYLKDALEHGMNMADPEDILMFTNMDIVLHKAIPKALRRHIAIWDVCSGHRCEFHYTMMPSLDASPSDFAKIRERHIGRDLFAFTKEWLVRNWDEIPDFILGASDFDLCLAWMIRLKKGFKCQADDLMDVTCPCELIPGHIIHQYHKPAWADPANVFTSPSQLHNRKLFYQWAATRGLTIPYDWVDGMKKLLNK